MLPQKNSVPKGVFPVKGFGGPEIWWIGSWAWAWLLYAGYNGLVFLIYARDKWKARRGAWRIPESVLLWLAFLGGAAGACLAIYGVRHKRRKPRFALGAPLMLGLQVALYGWVRGWFS